MSTLALMRARIRTLTSRSISEADIDELINRVHQEEIESGQWHYRKKHAQIVSSALKTSGTVSVTQGSVRLSGNGTTFDVSDIGKYIRIKSEDMAIPIADVSVFPQAIGYEALTVSGTPIPIATSFGGVGATKGTFTVTQGNIRYTYDGSTPTPTEGHLVFAGSEFVLEGHDNLDQFRAIAESTDANLNVTLERQTDDVILETAWPGATVTDSTYELFSRYYTMPVDCDIVLRVNRPDCQLRECTEMELDYRDPGRDITGDVAYHWAKAPNTSAGRRVIELWPVTTVSHIYGIEYLAGHTPLERDTDRPLCPPGIIEAKALMDSYLTLFAKTGDKRWTTLADGASTRYENEKEKMMAADVDRYGNLLGVLDESVTGRRGGYYDYAYMVNHDV